MKSIRIPAALVTVLTAALIAVCPMASQASGHAPETLREPASVSGSAMECPLREQAPPVGCAAGGDRDEMSRIVMHGAEEDDQLTAEQNDLSSALLEDLLTENPGMADTGP